MTRLRREAVRLIACDPELDRRETSALQILGELAVLPTCWTRASGWPSADWIRGSSSRGNRSRSGHGLAGMAVVTCVVLCTCRPWSHCVVIPISVSSIKTCSLAAKLGCKRWWQSCGNCCMLCLPCSAAINRWLQAVHGPPGRPCHYRLRLSDPKKREGSPHLS